MALKRTEEEEGVFEDLGITDEDMEKSYLAAFLACWLCKFVFPKDDVTLIRPGVFKVASRMAHGVSSVDVPVLANIYKGLQDISSADDPGNCTTVLPFHYVYGWLGEYFDTHFTSSSKKSIPIMARFSGRLSAKFFEDSIARALFRTYGKVEMSHLARVFSECKQLTDEDHISKEDFEYLICLRSRFVSLRQENYGVIQPYSSHRFSRQFCYVQHVPRELKDDVRNGTIGSASTITLPTKDNIREFEVTFDYVIWWSKVHRFDLTKSKTISIVGKSSSLSQPKSFKSQGNETLAHDKLTRGRALQVHPEVEGSYTTPVPRVQQPLPVDEDFIPLGRRIRRLKRGHISNNEDSEVNFRHKKTSVEPFYCDLDTTYPLDDTFFCDVPAISQPVLKNEGEVVHHVPTMFELVSFNHLPIEGENDTLHLISG
ncbi:unnamed protein product [Prunus armeniaca]